MPGKGGQTGPGGYRWVKPDKGVKEAIASLEALCCNPQSGAATSTMGGMALVAVHGLYEREVSEVQSRSSLYRGMLHMVEEGLAALWRLDESDLYRPQFPGDPATGKEAKYTLPEAVEILTTAIQKDFAPEIQRILEAKNERIR